MAGYALKLTAVRRFFNKRHGPLFWVILISVWAIVGFFKLLLGGAGPVDAVVGVVLGIAVFFGILALAELFVRRLIK
jgi:hypothetical protein